MSSSTDRVTAAVMIIGDEILSGRTQDTNLNVIAKYLGAHGVDLAEARVVGDIKDEIIAALNVLRGRYDYVITTGGIGPTQIIHRRPDVPTALARLSGNHRGLLRFLDQRGDLFAQGLQGLLDQGYRFGGLT